MDCHPPGSSVHGILQARILEWIAKPSSRRFSWSRDWTHISYVSSIVNWIFFLPSEPPRKPRLVLRSYLTVPGWMWSVALNILGRIIWTVAPRPRGSEREAQGLRHLLQTLMEQKQSLASQEQHSHCPCPLIRQLMPWAGKLPNQEETRPTARDSHGSKTARKLSELKTTEPQTGRKLTSANIHSMLVLGRWCV